MANLLKIGQLKAHPADDGEIARLLAAAERGIADARVERISPETRFDAAYRSITQIGLAARIAQGYRADTNRPGHDDHPDAHADARHRSTAHGGARYPPAQAQPRGLHGGGNRDASVAACIEAAEKLLRDANARLGKSK